MRVYSIELLRIIFTFFIIFGHFIAKMPELSAKLSHKPFYNTGFGVECFFIIAGFFLYEKLKNRQPDIKKFAAGLYLKVAPAFILAFLLNVVFFSGKFTNIFSVLFLNTGLSLPGEINGWGDWFVGVYFWIMLFYFVVLDSATRLKFLWIFILVYSALCLKINIPPLENAFVKNYVPLNGTYYGFIGVSVVRGIYGIGMGILTNAFISGLDMNLKKTGKIIFTLVEVLTFGFLMAYLVSGLGTQLFNILIIFCILLSSFYKGWGYLSGFLNRFNVFETVAKYCFPVFILHVIVVKLSMRLDLFRYQNLAVLSTMLLLSALLGILEYQLFEKRFLIYCKNKFNNAKKE